jgi:hypothetical protein
MAVVSSTAALVLVATGAFALGNQMGRNNVTELPAARAGTSSAIASDSATSGPATSKAATRKARSSTPPDVRPTKEAKVVAAPAVTPSTRTRTVTATPTSKPIIQLRGRVVDPDGFPLTGVYVLPGFPDSVAFAPHNGAYEQTNEYGEFSIPCPRSPVYLATWPLNRPITAASTGADYAPVWFGAPDGKASSVVPTCGRVRKEVVMQPVHTTVTGTVVAADGGTCAENKRFAVGIWINGNKGRSVRINGLTMGQTFTFDGLPEGTHTLNAGGSTSQIKVTAGPNPLQHDAVFVCHGPVEPTPPTETPDPSATPDPSTSPPPTGLPLPSVTPTP